MSDPYPILVRDFTGMQSLTIVCERCHAEEIIEADDILNEGLYSCPRGIVACGGTAVMKYEVADECPSCKTLGFYESTVNAGCCSRICMLQVEYAKVLGERRA